MNIRDQQDVYFEAHFHLVNILALFVQQERGDIDRNLRVHSTGTFFHRFFLNDAQDVQGRRRGIADMAEAVATRAGDVARFRQGRLQALTGKFEQSETGNFAGLHAGAVVAQCIAQSVFDFALILWRLHVDEVDYHQTTEIAQAQLTGNFVGRFAIGAERGFLDVVALGRARGVDVDRYQCFGMIDDDGTTGRQRDIAAVRGFNLVLDLKARK